MPQDLITKDVLLMLGKSWKHHCCSVTTNEEPFTCVGTEVCSHLRKILLIAVECMLTPVWRKRDWMCARNQQQVHRDFTVSIHPHWLLKIFPQWIKPSLKSVVPLVLLSWISGEILFPIGKYESLKIKVTVFIPRIFVLPKHILQAAVYIICWPNVSPTPTSL